MADVRAPKRLIENVELEGEHVPTVKRPVTWAKTQKRTIALKKPTDLENRRLEFDIAYKQDGIWRPYQSFLNLKVRKGYMVGGQFTRGVDPDLAVHEHDQLNAGGGGNPPQQNARAATNSVRWINGVGFMIIENIEVKPDGGNNLEATPTDTRLSYEQWLNYLHRFDKEEKENKVIRRRYLVDERLLSHTNPHRCGISTDRTPYRTAAGNVAPPPLSKEDEEMIDFERRQRWEEDANGWINIKVPLPGKFFTTTEFIHGLANFLVTIHLNSANFVLIGRSGSVDGTGAVVPDLAYEVDEGGTHLEITYYSQTIEEMKRFETAYFNPGQIQQIPVAYQANSYVSEAFRVNEEPGGHVLDDNNLINHKVPNHFFFAFIRQDDMLGRTPGDREPYAMTHQWITKVRFEMDDERVWEKQDLGWDDRRHDDMKYLWELQCDSVKNESSDDRQHPQDIEPYNLQHRLQYGYVDMTANGTEGHEFAADKMDKRFKGTVWAQTTQAGGRNPPAPAPTPWIHLVLTWFNVHLLTIQNAVNNIWGPPNEFPANTVVVNNINRLRDGKI